VLLAATSGSATARVGCGEGDGVDSAVVATACAGAAVTGLAMDDVESGGLRGAAPAQPAKNTAKTKMRAAP
jgi:hypothetical protein